MIFTALYGFDIQQMKQTVKKHTPEPSFSWSNEVFAGFSVFLLALPLSLGIAKASEFPAVTGLFTVLVGGLLVTWMMGAPLTIKGPAAGLIVIAAGSVNAFGGGIVGWQETLAVLLVSGIIQILLGILKLGRWVDFFPLSAVHGMLAAIGFIIISKQIPVLLDVDPALSQGMSPGKLIQSIPLFLSKYDAKATLIGVVSLGILYVWPYLQHPIRKIPAPLVVLAFAVPAELMLNFQSTAPSYALLQIGDVWGQFDWQVSWAGWHREPGIFLQYVALFAIIGSIESLLTVKAVSVISRKKADANRDLWATGVGNALVACVGGLPMISEVARSSASYQAGGRTRWVNFFHGLFLLIFLGVAVHWMELIPNTALAAMLIMVGWKLAHPRQLWHTLEKGKEQLGIFLLTFLVTLGSDLLWGILAGVLAELIWNAFRGPSRLKAMFFAPTEVSFNGEEYLVVIGEKAVFSNYLGILRKLEAIPAGFKVTIDLGMTHWVDHSVMQSLHQFSEWYGMSGGEVLIVGLEQHDAVANHRLSARLKSEPPTH